ncbi:MAG: hypothetical protein ACK44W_02045, partial [Planctomycetota bacterium]
MSAALVFGAIVLGAAQDVETLLEALRSEDPVERRRALEGLRARGPEGVSAAVRLLASSVPDPAARVAELVRGLTSPDWKERDRAMRNLAQLGRVALGALEASSRTAQKRLRARRDAAAAALDAERDAALAVARRR